MSESRARDQCPKSEFLSSLPFSVAAMLLVLYFFRLLNGSGDNVSDSGESHAYYSRVAKDASLHSLHSLEPPPLKEHLYQNFDQVFLAMEEKRTSQHPDLLNNCTEEQFYENTHSLSTTSPKEIVVNDEKSVCT